MTAATSEPSIASSSRTGVVIRNELRLPSAQWFSSARAITRSSSSRCGLRMPLETQ